MLSSSSVHVLEDLVSQETLEAFRNECDVHVKRQTTSIDAELERSCSIDLFEDACLSDSHTARTDADEYLSVRWRESQPSSIVHRENIRQFLFHTAPTQIQQILPHIYLSGVYLFNENYIVKSGHGSLQFRWHTDEQEQFKCHQMLLQQGDENSLGNENDAFCREYYSLWIPLDDCDEKNGTIVFKGTTNLVKLSRKCDGNFCNVSSSSHYENRGTSEDLILDIHAGSGVLFSSRMLHRSGPNMTSKERRVLYIQYSGEVITGMPGGNRGYLEEKRNKKRKLAKVGDDAAVDDINIKEGDKEKETQEQEQQEETPLSFAVKCQTT